VEHLCWLVETVQGATELPLCIDSPDPVAVAAALELVKGPVMVNSISLEKARIAGMLPLVKKHKTKIVALCQSDEGMANTADDKVRIAGQMVEILTKEGVPAGDIYIDPLVYPVATDSQSAVASIEAIGRITREIPGVHTIGGLTNV
jgi:5-methyltetrahydrofolate--homocysteine methyltransferase